MANNPRREKPTLPTNEKKVLPKQKTTVNKLQLPMIVDQIVQAPDTAAGPSQVQQIVQQSEEMNMLAPKNISGNKKKAKMDIVNYLSSLNLENTVHQPPLSVANLPEVTSRPIQPTSREALGRNVDFIKLNKLKLALQGMKNANREAKREKQMFAFKLKESSKAPSKFMGEHSKLVEDQRNSFGKNRDRGARWNLLGGSRRKEKVLQNQGLQVVKINHAVPSRYMECYRKIQLKALQNKTAFKNDTHSMQQAKKTKPFVYSKDFRKNATQVRHTKLVLNSRFPLKIKRFHNPTATKEQKSSKNKNEKGIEVKSRYMNFMKIVKHEQERKEVLPETSTQETQRRKKEAIKRELRKQVCGGAYNREWERRYKEQVAKWLRTRNVHLHNAEVKPANILKKTEQLRMKPANKTTKKIVRCTIGKAKSKSPQKTLFMKLTDKTVPNRTEQPRMKPASKTMKHILRPRIKKAKTKTLRNSRQLTVKYNTVPNRTEELRKAKTKTLEKSRGLFETLKATVNAAKKARPAQQSVQKEAKYKKSSTKGITPPMKHKKDITGKRNYLRRIEETYRDFTSDSSDHSMRYLYHSKPPTRYSVHSFFNPIQAEMSEIKRCPSYSFVLRPETS